MLTLISTILGFGTSFLPRVLDFFQDRQDKAHELAMMVKQAEIQMQLGEQRLQAAMVDGDIREIESAHKEQISAIKYGAKWLANLSGSIRPVVTYLFVIEYLGITIAIAFLMASENGLTIPVLAELLNEDFMAIFGSIISFHFGNRTFGRRQT